MSFITSNNIKTCFRKYLKKLSKPNIDDFMLLGDDTMLVEFLREQTGLEIDSMYDLNDRIVCEKARNNMQHIDGLKTENEMSQLLKHYAAFLEDPKFNPEPKVKTKRERRGNEELQSAERELSEGGKIHTEYERRYRNAELRRRCIEAHGCKCQVCGFDFSKTYGKDLGGGFIEVHHLEPISTFDAEHDVDPAHDLIPLCSNCHSMIHRGKNGLLTPDELRQIYNENLQR